MDNEQRGQHDLVRVAKAGAQSREGETIVARAVAISNITLSGISTAVDGVTLVSGDIVLVTAQTSAVDNGLYRARSGAWVRVKQIFGGMLVSIMAGNTNVGTLWTLAHDGPPDVGVDEQKWIVQAPVKCATAVRVATANVASLSGAVTIDGTATSAGEIILLTGQTTASQNGLWVAASSTWTRYPFLLTTGMIVTVTSGLIYINTIWILDTTGAIVPGTTSQSWTQLLNDNRWKPLKGITTTPTSAVRITMVSTAGIQKGSPIRYTMVAGGSTTFYYGVVSAITSTTIDIKSVTLTGVTLANVWVGTPEMLQQVILNAPGIYAITAQNILALIGRTYYTWPFASAWLVSFTAWSNTLGAGTAQINLKINSTTVATSDVTPSTSGVSSGVVLNPAIVNGDSVEIAVTATDASASDLTVACVFILA